MNFSINYYTLYNGGIHSKHTHTFPALQNVARESHHRNHQ